MIKKWKANMTSGSFKELFYDNLSKTHNFNAAYEASENEHEEYFNKRKYSDVSSFRSVLSKKKS